MDWMNTLEIPSEPRTSELAKRLIRALLTDADGRLCTPTWEIDLCVQRGHLVTAFKRMQVFKKDIRNHSFFRNAKLDFETVHLMKAPSMPLREESSTPPVRQSPVKADQTERAVKTKDVMLHDERVLNERRFRAFKNYTYRGPDLSTVVQRFNEAIDAGQD